MFFPKAAEEKRSRSSAVETQSNAKDHLEVHAVGAYLISIAKSVEDLRRIDPSVFKVSDTIDVLFRQHYAEGFGFVICRFDATKGVQGHPIGYVHDPMPNGTLFVPCRHEHGHGTTETENFSHEIYSLNTGKEAGSTRADLGWKGTTPDYIPSQKKEIPYVPKPIKDVPGGGIATTDIKCLGGCTFWGGISGHCSTCWKKLTPDQQQKHTQEQRLSQPDRDKAAFEVAQRKEAGKVSAPLSEAEAIQSVVLTPYVPQIKSLRQRVIQGYFKNEDLYFPVA